MKAFVFDLAKCNGCYGCQIACKDEMCDNEWLPYSLPQPDLGQFWMKVTQETAGQVPKVRVNYEPHMCNHCADAPCMAAAPEAVYRREDGLVIIDPIKAQGNKALKDACPYGAIYYNDVLDVAQKCTGCAHLVDRGMLPHCVDLCGTYALRFGDVEEFGDELKDAVQLTDAAHGGLVYYLNMPKPFIGGEVWDPAIDECLIGATIQLTCPDGNVLTTQTDGFGDFWFKKLDAGKYALDIVVPGYKPVHQDIDLVTSLNVGDFPLEQA